MIVWQGFGFLAVLIPLGVFILAGFLNTNHTEVTNTVMATVFLISAILVWVVGKQLNGKPGKILIDPETQQEVELKNKHTLFWIPMEWIAIVWVLMAAFSFVR